MMTLDLSYQDAEYAAWTAWRPESPPDKRDAHCHGFDAGYKVGLAAREEPLTETSQRLVDKHIKSANDFCAAREDTPTLAQRRLDAVNQTLTKHGAPTHDKDGTKLNANGRLVDFLAAREDTQRPEAKSVGVREVGPDDVRVGDIVWCGGWRTVSEVIARGVSFEGSAPRFVFEDGRGVLCEDTNLVREPE